MMESPMTRNCHVGFGERYEETHQSQDWKVRFVPTLFSPLLSNIALHGMENRIKQIKGASLIRYADDFVIFHEILDTLKVCQNVISDWLSLYDLELKPSIAKLLKKQNGKCNWCNLNFRDEDLIETDHIIPKRADGNNSTDNLQLLHKHCHDAKTYSDQLVIKLHKAQKEGEKTQKWFNNLDWL